LPVEKLCADEASVALAIFSGSTAKERAIRCFEAPPKKEIESGILALGKFGFSV
jgi:hypothetical protein